MTRLFDRFSADKNPIDSFFAHPGLAQKKLLLALDQMAQMAILQASQQLEEEHKNEIDPNDRAAIFENVVDSKHIALSGDKNTLEKAEKILNELRLQQIVMMTELHEKANELKHNKPPRLKDEIDQLNHRRTLIVDNMSEPIFSLAAKRTLITEERHLRNEIEKLEEAVELLPIEIQQLDENIEIEGGKMAITSILQEKCLKEIDRLESNPRLG